MPQWHYRLQCMHTRRIIRGSFPSVYCFCLMLSIIFFHSCISACPPMTRPPLCNDVSCWLSVFEVWCHVACYCLKWLDWLLLLNAQSTAKVISGRLFEVACHIVTGHMFDREVDTHCGLISDNPKASICCLQGCLAVTAVGFSFFVALPTGKRAFTLSGGGGWRSHVNLDVLLLI